MQTMTLTRRNTIAYVTTTLPSEFATPTARYRDRVSAILGQYHQDLANIGPALEKRTAIWTADGRRIRTPLAEIAVDMEVSGRAVVELVEA